jgi:hypothetical protein
VVDRSLAMQPNQITDRFPDLCCCRHRLRDLYWIPHALYCHTSRVLQNVQLHCMIHLPLIRQSLGRLEVAIGWHFSRQKS